MATGRPAADDSESKPRDAPQDIFTLDALPAATVSISRLSDRLRICWLAYPEAKH